MSESSNDLDCVGDVANGRVIVYGLNKDLDLNVLEPSTGLF
jgi:hypothetical protein